MPDYDSGFKIVARQVRGHLGRLAHLPLLDWVPIVDTLQTTERLADRAFRTQQGGERLVIYLEAYTRWQNDAPWSILEKSGLLARRERLPVISLLFVLTPRGYRPQNGTFRLEAVGSVCQQVWFHEIRMWELEPEGWWEEIPGLLALFPLCRHGRRPREAVRWAAEKICEITDPGLDRADMLTVLGVFGKLAAPRINVLELIGREQMKESPFYKQILEEGREEGLITGRTEGRLEGRLEGARSMLQMDLEDCYGEQALELSEALETIRDLDVFRQLKRELQANPSWPDFRRAFRRLVR